MKKITYAFLLLLSILTYSCLDENEKSLSDSSKNTNKNLRIIGPDGLPLPYDVLGAGYDVTGEVDNPSDTRGTIVDMVKLNKSLPNSIEVQNRNDNITEETIGENVQSYLGKLSSKFNLSGDFYFIRELNTFPYFSIYDAIDSRYVFASRDKIYVRQRFIFKRDVSYLRNFLTEGFKSSVIHNSPADLVSSFGTHVLVDVSIGGKIKTRLVGIPNSPEREKVAKLGLDYYYNNAFLDNFQDNNFSAIKDKFKSVDFKIRSIQGGEALNFPSIFYQKVKESELQTWMNSIVDANSGLVKIGENGLIPIYDLIEDPVKKESVKQYVEQYLKDNGVKMKNQPVPINHWYSSRSSDSYFTQSDNLPFTLTHQFNDFKFAGAPFYAFDFEAPGTVPVYSIWAPGSDCHRLSTSRAMCCGDVFEGIAFYAYPSAGVKNTVPIHLSTRKLWSKNIKRNKSHYNLTVGENLDRNYARHGVQFYAVKAD